MNINFTNRKQISTLLVLGIATAMLPAMSLADSKIVSLSNQVSGNSLQIFSVMRDGSLKADGSVLTGGIGTGSGLGSQGSVAYDSNSETIAAVNAGDNTVSVLSSRWNRIRLMARTSTLGFRPVSVTLRDNIMFVLNQGDGTHSSSIQGFRLNGANIVPIQGGASGLSANYTNPAQISFSPNGRNLVVTEKGTNRIGVFGVNRFGILEGSQFTNSNGATPFGFAFSNSGHLFVTEAFGGASGVSAASTYSRISSFGVNVISPSVATTQTAACWAVISPDDRYAFAANTGSGTVSTFDLSRHGLITLVGNSTPIQGSVPVDLAINKNGRSLYMLGAGIHGVVSFSVGQNGLLNRMDTDGVATGSVGLAFIN